MAQGIAFPFRASPRKGVELSEGPEYIRHLVLVALGDCDSDNPYQDLGIGNAVIFRNLSNPAVQGWVTRKVRDIFRTFEAEELARLHTLDFEGSVDDGDLTALITYVDLETNTPNELRVSLPLPGSEV